jgi:hypothetical protein
MTLWHATERAWAKEILQSGFYGSWGDCAFGVYFFDNLRMAVAWARKNPVIKYKDPVLIEARSVEVRTCEDIMGSIPADWENEREKYEHTWVHVMSEDNEEGRWKPVQMQIIELSGPSKPS